MTANPANLEPIGPGTARELFLQHKEGDCSDSTVRNYKYHLKSFVEWCHSQEIDNLNDITGRDLQQFRLWRQNEFDISRMTVKNHMSSMRVFLKWAASIEAVPSELYDKVLIPRVPPEDRKRDEMLDHDAAKEIIEYLGQYHYASAEHVIMAILWETGIRSGGLRAIDTDDVLFDRQALRILHRPEQGTPLKNGERGERLVAISDELRTIISDYLQDRRDEVSDDFGRDPLITTTQGRMTLGTIRRAVYKVTSPCWRDNDCRDCAGVAEEKCPKAVCPHAVRRGSITYHLSEDVPEKVVSDRMNVSQKVLEEHYDERSEEVKLEQRRRYLE
ncbi:site-specific integrase [Haloarculaceae archaeon H-GB11]|nr:site-specific integrase [Haloarculaceae archaeon H-GB11]